MLRSCVWVSTSFILPEGPGAWHVIDLCYITGGNQVTLHWFKNSRSFGHCAASEANIEVDPCWPGIQRSTFFTILEGSPLRYEYPLFSMHIDAIRIYRVCRLKVSVATYAAIIQHRWVLSILRIENCVCLCSGRCLTRRRHVELTGCFNTQPHTSSMWTT